MKLDIKDLARQALQNVRDELGRKVSEDELDALVERRKAFIEMEAEEAVIEHIEELLQDMVEDE